MNPNPNKIYTSEDNVASSAVGTTIGPSAPPEGTEGVLPLPTHDKLKSEARDMLAAEFEAASHSKAPGK